MPLLFAVVNEGLIHNMVLLILSYHLIALTLLHIVIGTYLNYERTSVEASSVPMNYGDTFYTPPDGFENTTPGTILRHRKTPRPLWLVYGSFDAQESWQMLVRLHDAQNRPVAIVTTVIRPFDANTLQILSYQVAQDSATSQCAPSYLLQQGASLSDTVTLQPEFVLIRQMLKEGSYVVVPDHQGPQSGFTVGRLMGKTTLDSLRAVYASGNFTGISSDAVLIMWGYLGGSIALTWASVLQPLYAPDLTGRLIGLAIGGLVPNITAVAEAVDGTYLSGLITNAIQGLIQEYPQNISEYIYASMNPGWAQHMRSINSLCLMSTIDRFAGFHFFEGLDRVFAQGWDLIKYPPVQEIIRENTLAVDEVTLRAPSIPVMMYHGQRDRVAPIHEVLRVYDSWCTNSDQSNMSVVLSVNQNSGHLSEFVEGLQVAADWIKDRFAGKPMENGCRRLNRTEGRIFSL